MNLVLCERYSTKMTAAACEKFKENTPQRCKGCAGPVKTDQVNADHFAGVGKMIEKPKGKKMNQGGFPEKPMKICSVAGCNEKHLAKGFCKKHYDANRSDELKSSRAEKTGDRKRLVDQAMAKVYATDKPQAAAPAEPRTSNMIGRIEIKFYERDQLILEQIETSAISNRRSLNQEILFRLERVDV
jgi:hypothetical protein